MDLFDFSAFSENLSAINKKKDELSDISSRSLKTKTKIKFENKLKKESVSNIITESSLPSYNECLHIVSNGSFDYFTLIPAILEIKCNAKDFWFTTWTMSHNNVIQILELYDKGMIKNINALTGEYFRSRESAVYSILELGIKERSQLLACNKNHSKITLLMTKSDYYVIEGSANFTANPRIEQFCITNSAELYEFHKEWMTEIINKNKVK